MLEIAWLACNPKTTCGAMKSKSLVWCVSLLILFAVFSIEHPGCAQSLAVVKDLNQPVQNASSSVSHEAGSARSPSPNWQTCLWESMPLDWLQDSDQTALLEAYEQNGWQPLFITAGFEINPNGRLLLRRLETIQDEAIDPRPFQLEDLKLRIQKLEGLRLSPLSAPSSSRDASAASSHFNPPREHHGGSAGSPSDHAVESFEPPAPGSEKKGPDEDGYPDIRLAACAIDLRLAYNLIRFANTMAPDSKELQVSALLGHLTMDEFISTIEPRPAQYQTLVQALRKYRDLAANVLQQRLVQSQKLSPGDAGNPIRDLQKRLQQEDFYQGKITGSFDEATKEAVQRFQAFHNLETDGKVGPQTREWLNISFQDKAEMIGHALHLYRQSQTRRHQRFVWVNIPQFTLEYYNEGKIEATHRVIVGKASGKKISFNGRQIGENQTPTMIGNIEQVVINPRWYVSDRIRLELSDAIAADPSFLARNGYVEMTSSRYPSGEPRLIQLPGPNNALGKVRFDFPNPYAVYMHDTPNKSLFKRARRDFSHGCIRVEKAHELAQELLIADQNPTASKIDSYLATSRETFLRLREPVPIIIEYVPVVVNSEGNPVFCGDPYGWFKSGSGRKS